VFILDKSGSMGGLESDTIGGYNSMLAKQQAVEGEAQVTTVLFDNNYELLNDRIDIKAVSPITEREYQVGGSTALLDAIGRTIHKIGNAQIERQKSRYGWEFIFLGANIDAVETAARFGISRDRALDYVPDSKGTEINFKAMSAAVMSFRECGEVDEESFAEVRSDYKKRGGRK
jgi:hypothetical protein